jgi:hypothetical protein
VPLAGVENFGEVMVLEQRQAVAATPTELTPAAGGP